MQYFAQDEATRLDPTLTVYQTLAGDAPMHMVPSIRNILGGFLFSGDDVDKPVRVLSGGERTRLAVARMLLRPSNTLLLDEPTNHLDLDSKDVLLEALEDFGGTLIFVSHDRYFVDRLATKVVEIGNGQRAGLSRATTRSSSGAGSSRRRRARDPGRHRTGRAGSDPRRTGSVPAGVRPRRSRVPAPAVAARPTYEDRKRADAEARRVRKATRRAPEAHRGARGAHCRPREAPSRTSRPRCPLRGSTRTGKRPSPSSTATRRSCGRLETSCTSGRLFKQIS